MAHGLFGGLFLATQEMAHNLERAAHRTNEIANMRLDD